jgi:predicted DNA-binding WGR domain protein
MNADKRRFEMIEGSSSKFWEIAVSGKSFTVTYGRIGTAGTSKTTTTASAQEAEAEAAKLVREKVEKGYQELGATAQSFRAPAHFDTHKHAERFLNYKVVGFNPDADSDGDESGRRELPSLRELDKLVYFVGLTFDDSEETFSKRLDALLNDPKVGDLRALLIGNWFGDVCEEPPTALYNALIRHGTKLKSLKGLFIGDVIQEECEISWLHQGDCAPTLRALPQLEELVVRGGDGLRFIDVAHASLRSLTVQAGGLGAETVRDIVRADLPSLTRLTLWLGDENYGGTTKVADLEPLLSGARFPALEHLGLQNAEHQDEIAIAVAQSPLLARLQGLDLSMGTLGDEGAAALLASPHIRSLKHLNLRYHFMSPAMVTKIRALGIEVNVSDRQDAADEDDRYVEVSE